MKYKDAFNCKNLHETETDCLNPTKSADVNYNWAYKTAKTLI